MQYLAHCFQSFTKSNSETGKKSTKPQEYLNSIYKGHSDWKICIFQKKKSKKIILIKFISIVIIILSHQEKISGFGGPKWSYSPIFVCLWCIVKPTGFFKVYQPISLRYTIKG